METNGWKIAFLSLTFLLVVGAVGAMAYFVGQGKLILPAFLTSPTPSPQVNQESPFASPSSQVQTGTIEGSLSYPSEGIPETLQVCAQEMTNNKQFCTSKHLQNSKYQYGVGYRLEVSPGTYQVYAFLPKQPEVKAYYSEAVPCGLTVSCTSHQPIDVTVQAGEIVSNIDPQDWYAPVGDSSAIENEDNLIKQAIYQKTGLNEATADIAVNQNTGTYATGNIKEKEAVGGAYWLAAKKDGQWVAVYDGQAYPTCAQIAPYNFPISMVPACLDSSNNVVSR